MGKRELLLIAGFVVLGAVIYQFTAPERDPARSRFSFGRLMDEIRREVRGRTASVERTRTDTHAVPPGTAEIRVTLQNTPVTIVGEARADVASELWITSNGTDEAEANTLIDRAVFSVEAAGPTIIVGLRFPPEGTQRARLTLRVPSGMQVQFGPTNARIEISGVTGVELEAARRETIVRAVSGRVGVNHRGGDLTIEDAGSLRLTARGSNVRVQRIGGEASLQVVAGELRAGALLGAVDLEATDTEVTLEDLQKARGPLRLRATNGMLRVRDLRTQARIDGRGTDIEIVLDEPAALAVFNSNDRIEFTPPRGGYSIDAMSDGEIVVADALKSAVTLATQPGGGGTRASGAVNGGGPTITLRNSRGEIRINTRG